MTETVEREDLYVPDRFEQLREAGSGQLRSVVVPVQASLDEITARFVDMRGARRGGLWVLRGNPGSGKSTFLDTVGLFRQGVVTERIPLTADIGAALDALDISETSRIVVVEGREALLDVSEGALESSMHAINTFVRAPSGKQTLVVWPTNTDGLADALVALGTRLGGTALLGSGDPVGLFSGPPQDQYVSIAERTVGALNEGASLNALGVSEAEAHELAAASSTVGDFLATVRGRLIANGARVRALMTTEQPRVWIVVVAGNDPEGDVAALTRGGFSYADVDRLMTATNANIVSELKKEPDTLGILGTVLDAKVLHVDMLTILAISRQYASDELRMAMKGEGLSVSADPEAINRLGSSQLGLVLSGKSLGTRRRGGKPGGGTKTAFAGLAKIARANDGLLNDAIGRALVAAGMAESYETEIAIGTDHRYVSDLQVIRAGEPIRIEIMWRGTTSQADIANYVLTKLGNYAKAIGLL